MGLRIRHQGSIGQVSYIKRRAPIVIRNVGAFSAGAALTGAHAFYDDHEKSCVLLQPDLGHDEARLNSEQSEGIYQQISAVGTTSSGIRTPLISP